MYTVEPHQRRWLILYISHYVRIHGTLHSTPAREDLAVIMSHRRQKDPFLLGHSTNSTVLRVLHKGQPGDTRHVKCLLLGCVEVLCNVSSHMEYIHTCPITMIPDLWYLYEGSSQQRGRELFGEQTNQKDLPGRVCTKYSRRNKRESGTTSDAMVRSRRRGHCTLLRRVVRGDACRACLPAG